MKIEVTPATPGLISALDDLLEAMQEERDVVHKAGRVFGVNTDPDTLRAVFRVCARPREGRALDFSLLWIDDQPAGFCVLQENTVPTIQGESVVLHRYGFVWVLYKRPRLPGVGTVFQRGNSEWVRYMVEWGKERGISHIVGNCSPDFPTKAAERWGFFPHHLVMGLEVK